MIITKHFVYIHTSRTAGSFLNKLILEQVPGARMFQYHGHLTDLPEEFSHLPVIGFVRNPWDWYVSMFFDYRRKQQYVFEILSDGGKLGFEETVSSFLRLGDNSDRSKQRLSTLSKTAPKFINSRVPPRHRLPGLRAEHFEQFSEDLGYYSWLFKLMYETNVEHDIHIGRFENLREDMLRLLEVTGTPITTAISSYLGEARAINSSPRPRGFVRRYSPELKQLIALKDEYLIDRFAYEFTDQ